MYIAYFGPFPVCDKDLLSSDFAIFHSQLNRFFVQYLVNKRERAQKNRLSLTLQLSLSPSPLFPFSLTSLSHRPIPQGARPRAPRTLLLSFGRMRRPSAPANTEKKQRKENDVFVLERFMQLISRWLNGQFSFFWRKSPHHLRLRWMHL